MKHFVFIIGLLLLIVDIPTYSQDNKNISKKELDKTIFTIRENSRDLAPVRRTNLHNQVGVSRRMMMINQKRGQINKQRAHLFRQKMIQNRKKINAQRRIIQKRMMQRRMMQQKRQMRKRMQGR